jgi:hypothetical protein
MPGSVACKCVAVLLLHACLHMCLRQALFADDALLAVLLQRGPVSPDGVLLRLRKAMGQLAMGFARAQSVADLHAVCPEPFNGYGQQDATEFTRLLLDMAATVDSPGAVATEPDRAALNDAGLASVWCPPPPPRRARLCVWRACACLGVLVSFPRRAVAPPRRLWPLSLCVACHQAVKTLYYGLGSTTVTCRGCGTVSTSREAFTDVALSVPGDSADPVAPTPSLRSRLEVLLEPEALLGDAAYDCTICHRKVPADRQLRVESAPASLVVSLSRFRYDVASKAQVKVRLAVLRLTPPLSPQRLSMRSFLVPHVTAHAWPKLSQGTAAPPLARKVARWCGCSCGHVFTMCVRAVVPASGHPLYLHTARVGGG